MSADPQSIPAYDPSVLEPAWQERWAERGTDTVDFDGAANPFYALMMFPYPSAEGLHVGNLFAFTGSDISARFHRLRGHDVFQPLGFDAFGIHSENYALKVGAHPMTLTPRNVANFERQLRRVGLMVDWRQKVDTSHPDYYRWTQWVFLQLHKQGLVYKKSAAVNWCPNDKTVLANEQVEGGLCERCGTAVEQRVLEQWFVRISEYAGRLLENLDGLDWSEITKSAQRNWIGRSEGAEVAFRISGHDETIRVFTTRPDTVFGATYLVLAPEHPLVEQITTDTQRAAVADYQEQTARQDLVTRKTVKEKTGVFTGAVAVNPATGTEIPVWISDYVLMEYGTGAIMAVPGHDERDFEFATKFALPIVRVVAGPDDAAETPLTEAYVGKDGARVVNSGRFDGLAVDEAIGAVAAWLAESGHAERVVNYRLHDWCISRQRYWGPPIPIVYCDSCGAVPVPEDELPVELPHLEDFRPDDSGVSPLARDEAWYRVPCPSCGSDDARRETDVSDTFLDSAWYFLRYPSATHADVPFDAARTKRWLPVDSYIGGNEHAVLHLLYSRFVTMALHDAGLLPFEEPFTRFRAHGLIIREGAKMSKSKGNVINPDEYVAEWGADAFRMYLMFLGPYQEGGDFRDQGISGVKRFLDRLWTAVHVAARDGTPDRDVLRKLHQTIRKVEEDTAALGYNTAIAAMMEYMNVLRRSERVPHVEEVRPLVQLVAAYAPHFAEECWATLGGAGSVFDAGWPAFDAQLAREDEIEVVVQVKGKTRGRVRVPAGAGQPVVLEAALAEPGVAKFVTGEPKKVIYVPGRLLNLVV